MNKGGRTTTGLTNLQWEYHEHFQANWFENYIKWTIFFFYQNVYKWNLTICSSLLIKLNLQLQDFLQRNLQIQVASLGPDVYWLGINISTFHECSQRMEKRGNNFHSSLWIWCKLDNKMWHEIHKKEIVRTYLSMSIDTKILNRILAKWIKHRWRVTYYKKVSLF